MIRKKPYNTLLILIMHILMIVKLLFFLKKIEICSFVQRTEKKMTACSYEREAEWPPPWLSKQFLSLRNLPSPDSHRSDMTDQDKWSGSDVRSVQSSNCPRQKQKGTLSTRLSSLQCLFNSFHPYYVHNKTVTINRILTMWRCSFFIYLF